MNVGVEMFAAVIVFFLGLIFLLVAYYTKKTAKSDTLELTDVTKEIVAEIEASTDRNIAKLERKNEELSKKLERITEVEQNIERMYHQLEEKNSVQIKKFVPKFTNIDDKKKQVYQLHKEGLAPDEIAKRLKMQKGVIETILNFGDYHHKI